MLEFRGYQRNLIFPASGLGARLKYGAVVIRHFSGFIVILLCPAPISSALWCSWMTNTDSDALAKQAEKLT